LCLVRATVIEQDERVYFDNVIASGRVLGDLVPESEMEAVRVIEAAHQMGLIKRVTSQESGREQQRTRDPLRRAKLVAAANELSAVPTDYAALAAMVSGESMDVEGILFNELRRIGLKDGDARHLVNAARSACVRFVTLDPHFLNRRPELELLCGELRIMKPSELAKELTHVPGSEGAG
jgi:hypothetical protein